MPAKDGGFAAHSDGPFILTRMDWIFLVWNGAGSGSAENDCCRSAFASWGSGRGHTMLFSNGNVLLRGVISTIRCTRNGSPSPIDPANKWCQSGRAGPVRRPGNWAVRGTHDFPIGPLFQQAEKRRIRLHASGDRFESIPGLEVFLSRSAAKTNLQPETIAFQ